LVAKAQEELSKRLTADLKKQGSSAAAIQKLKSLLAGKKKAKSTDTVEYQKFAMDPEDDPKAKGNKEVEPVQQTLITLRKSSFSFRDVLKKDEKKGK
jgi:hypothetical protein